MAIQRLKVDQSVAGDGLGIDSKGVMNVNIGDGFNIDKDILKYELADSTLIVDSNGVKVNPVIINNLSTEVSNRISGDTILTNNLSTEVSIRSSSDVVISTSLSIEISSRLSVDSVVSMSLSTEISTRTSQSATISNNLSTETSSRVSGDTILTNNLSSEVSLRTTQSTTISTSINNLTSTDTLEASIRLSADTILTNNLSTEISIRTSQSTTVSTTLSTELSIPSITGCKLQWVSTTALTTSTGSINISGVNYIINTPITIGWSNIYSDSTKTANTWYYVYLKNISGTITPYISITTPIKDAFGNTITADAPCAKYHPTLLGRFIGSFKTDASSNITNFDILGNYVAFVGLGANYILSSGSVTTKTLVNCRTMVPYTSSLARIYYEIVSGTGSRYIADSTITYLTTKYGSGTLVMPITNNGIYYYVSATNNPTSIGIHGYFEDV